jgi:uncharacterized damage-inducible protein DinB
MNPYASFLGTRDPREVIAATTGRLKDLFAPMSPEQAETAPAPGKWSAREILGHLADCEIVFAFRLRQAVAEDHHIIQPFDQDRFAATAGAYDVASALAVFSAVRDWNRIFIDGLPGEAFAKPLTHPERGPMTFQVIVETIGGHDLNHLGQLDRIAHGND